MDYTMYSVQFTVLTTLPTHTHTSHREWTSRVPILPGASETGQADHDTLHTAEAQVTSAE